MPLILLGSPRGSWLTAAASAEKAAPSQTEGLSGQAGTLSAGYKAGLMP